ncbi:MAG: MaoC family dehydratase N-terminal domain-containing protein [Desulfobacterales bacterium]|nr:MaoC family dehydratase N-terminal domain-containing protein [Desulfobacterales bacterium]
MKLSSRLTGTRLKPHTADISWRQTTNFAAAVLDRTPVYFDDTGEAGLVAPPTFPVAVTWPVLSRLGEFIDSDEFPLDVLLTQVHYTEHLIIHRLVRPEDRLTLDGEIAAILPHRAGTHAVIKLTATDKTGHPVFTEYIGAMLRGVECRGEAGRDALPALPEFDPDAAPAWTSPQAIDPLAPYIYDGCTDVEFPIHTSPRFAARVGLPGIILQGTATLAYAVRDMVAHEAGNDPAAVKEIACSFTGMVMPGSDIEICCLGSRREENHTHLFFEVINAKNEKAIRNGYMKIERNQS